MHVLAPVSFGQAILWTFIGTATWLVGPQALRLLFQMGDRRARIAPWALFGISAGWIICRYATTPQIMASRMTPLVLCAVGGRLGAGLLASALRRIIP